MVFMILNISSFLRRVNTLTGEGGLYIASYRFSGFSGGRFLSQVQPEILYKKKSSYATRGHVLRNHQYPHHLYNHIRTLHCIRRAL